MKLILFLRADKFKIDEHQTVNNLRVWWWRCARTWTVFSLDVEHTSSVISTVRIFLERTVCDWFSTDCKVVWWRRMLDHPCLLFNSWDVTVLQRRRDIDLVKLKFSRYSTDIQIFENWWLITQCEIGFEWSCMCCIFVRNSNIRKHVRRDRRSTVNLSSSVSSFMSASWHVIRDGNSTASWRVQKRTYPIIMHSVTRHRYCSSYHVDTSVI